MPEVTINVNGALSWITHPQTRYAVFNNEMNVGVPISIKSTYGKMNLDAPRSPIIMSEVRSKRPPETDLPIIFANREYTDLWKDARPSTKGKPSDLVLFIVKYIDPQDYVLVFTCNDIINKNDFINVLNDIITRKNMGGCINILDVPSYPVTTIMKPPPPAAAAAPPPVAVKQRVISADQYRPSQQILAKKDGSDVVGTKRDVEAKALVSQWAAAPPGGKKRALVAEMKSRGYGKDPGWISGIMTGAGVSPADITTLLSLL
jgi:hypothetical protein